MRPVCWSLTVVFVLGLCGMATAQTSNLPPLLTDYGIRSLTLTGASTELVLTRETAIGAAIAGSPRLKSLAHEIRSLSFAARQVKAYPNPSLTVEVEDWGRQQERGPSQTTFGLEQQLPLWGKRARASEAVDARRRGIESEWNAEALAIYSRVSSLYAILLGGQSKLDQASKRLSLARETELAVAIKLKEGAVPESEVQRAKASRSLAQIDSLVASSEVSQALAELSALVGAGLEGIPVEGKLLGDVQLALPDTVAMLLRRHPLVVSRTAERDARKRDVLLARALGKPDPTVSAGFRRLHDSGDNGFLLGVSIPLPIRNPNAAGIAESESRVDAAESDVEQILLDLESELRRLVVAWQRKSAEIAMIQSQTLPAIESSLASLDLAYRVGQQPYMNLLDVQRSQSEIQTRLIDAMVDKSQIEAQLETLLGQRLVRAER